MTIRCYVCGTPLGMTFYLMTLLDDVDRVFLIDEDCLPQLDKDTLTCAVQRGMSVNRRGWV